MTTLYKTINYRGCTIQIHYDDNPESPQDWYNEDIFLIHQHRDFTIEKDGFELSEIFAKVKALEDATGNTALSYNEFWVIPVFSYIHSGVSLSLDRSYPFNDRFDSSRCAVVLVKRDEWETIKEARLAAKSLIETWNDYLSGNVYTFETIEDSCGGYYGEEGLKEAIKDAKLSIDYYIKNQVKNHVKQLKKWIKSNVSLIYRNPFNYELAES